MEAQAIVSGSSLFQYNRAPRHRSPLFIGLAFALILHLGLIAYLITQTIVTTPIEVVDMDPPIMGGIVNLVRPEPDPKPPINLHKPQNPRPVDDPLTATPPDKPATLIADEPTKGLTPPEGGTVEGPVQTGTGTPVATSPKWSRFPGPEALSTYYPPRALDAEVEGTATLECVVLDTKGRVGCKVLKELPGGYGFGEATRKMVEKIGRVETGQGANPVGTVMRLSVAWQLPT